MKAKPFARQLKRVRRICLELPDVMEKISHGEPTYFLKKRVIARSANNHHGEAIVHRRTAGAAPPDRRRSGAAGAPSGVARWDDERGVRPRQVSGTAGGCGVI